MTDRERYRIYREIIQLMESVPEPHRQRMARDVAVWYLRRYQGMSLRAIGEVVKLNPTSVKWAADKRERHIRHLTSTAAPL